jgi:hypothetical protein
MQNFECHESFDAYKSIPCGNIESWAFPKGFWVAKAFLDNQGWICSSWFVELKLLDIW